MPTSKIHGYRTSYSAPVTQQAGAKRTQETLMEFLARIKEQEKEIMVGPGYISRWLADLPPSQWAEYVANLWENKV